MFLMPSHRVRVMAGGTWLAASVVVQGLTLVNGEQRLGS